MARCRDRVGALVIGDGVGEQGLAVLADFDIAAGNDQRQLVGVLDLVGAEHDRGVGVLLRTRPLEQLGAQPAAR